MLRALVIALVLAACRDPALDELAAIKSEVCACKTSACGEAAMKKIPPHGPPPDHRMQEVARKLLDCMAELYKKDRPSTDPDAEAPAPTSPGSAAPASGGTP